MTSYIVRIYRRDPTGADEVAGIAEIPEQGAQVAFRSFNELRAILARDVLDEATATGNATASKSKRKTSRRGV